MSRVVIRLVEVAAQFRAKFTAGPAANDAKRPALRRRRGRGHRRFAPACCCGYGSCSPVVRRPAFAGEDLAHNCALLRAVPAIGEQLGCRVLVGLSRKRMLPAMAGRDIPVQERDHLGHPCQLAHRCAILRVHDVSGTMDAVSMALDGVSGVDLHHVSRLRPLFGTSAAGGSAGFRHLLAIECARWIAGLKPGVAITISAVVAAAFLARLAQLHAITWLLENAISFSAIILAIVFQSEVRRLFSRMGGWLPSHLAGDTASVIDQLLDAVEFMASRKIGALLVIERTDRLDDYVAASPLDCEITPKILCTIFWKDSPLHDGAMIIRNGRISAAGVILPLTENFEYKDLSGTRHRAAIGIQKTPTHSAWWCRRDRHDFCSDNGKLITPLTREDLGILLSRSFGGGRAARRATNI